MLQQLEELNWAGTSLPDFTLVQWFMQGHILFLLSINVAHYKHSCRQTWKQKVVVSLPLLFREFKKNKEKLRLCKIIPVGDGSSQTAAWGNCPVSQPGHVTRARRAAVGVWEELLRRKWYWEQKTSAAVLWHVCDQGESLHCSRGPFMKPFCAEVCV